MIYKALHELHDPSTLLTSSQLQCPHIGTLFQSRGLPCWFSPSLGSYLRAFAHACCWVTSRYPLEAFPLSVPSALLHSGTFYSPFLLWFFFHLSPPDNPINFTYLGFVFFFWLHWVFVVAYMGFLQLQHVDFSCCGAKASSCVWASHCVDFSCGTQALEHVGSLVAPKACGILVPKPGIEPMSPAVEGGFLTTGPLGKSLNYLFSRLPLPQNLSPMKTELLFYFVHFCKCLFCSLTSVPGTYQALNTW